MVIAATLGRKGASAKATHVTCTVTADKGDAGIKLVTSKLQLVVEGLSGMDAATFDDDGARKPKGSARSRTRFGATSRSTSK